MDQRSFRSRQWSASFAPGRAANGKTTRLSPNGEIVPLGRRHSALASMRQIAGNCRRVRGTEREGSLSGVIAERGGRRHSRRRQEAAAAGGGRRRHRIGRMPFSFSRSLGHLICHVVSCKVLCFQYWIMPHNMYLSYLPTYQSMCRDNLIKNNILQN